MLVKYYQYILKFLKYVDSPNLAILLLKMYSKEVEALILKKRCKCRKRWKRDFEFLIYRHKYRDVMRVLSVVDFKNLEN